jgi:hypothetical protein
MPDKAGPKSSSSDFEWPAWQQGQDGSETIRSSAESARSSDTGAASQSSEAEQETYVASDSPPPVIDAFPEQKLSYEPAPEPAEDDPGVIPWPLTITIILASLTVIALIAVLVAVINGGDTNDSSNRASATSASATASTTEVVQPPVTVTSEETQTQTVTVTPTPSSTTSAPTYYPPTGSSLQQLQRQVRIDHDPVLQGANNQWMPQLGSKKLGTLADGKSYSYDDILANYYQLKQKYPGARLLWSGDWSTFGEADYWVTVANIATPTSDQALSWCRTNVGPDNNNCYAKLISTTHPVEESTAYQ